MQADFATTILLPLSLVIIMFGMGLDLRAADFARILRQPRAAGIGLACQLLLLPVLALLIAVMLQLSPEMSVGLILLACCPGGATSNIITYYARGDAALSITLTAFVSVLTVFTIPLFTNMALVHFLGEGNPFHLPFLETVIKISVIVLIPVLVGMLVRRYLPRFALACGPWARMSSVIIFIGVVIYLVFRDVSMIKTAFVAAGVASIVLNLITMGAGYAVATATRLSAAERVTVTIEVGIQNGTMAIVIALTLLNNGAFALPAAFYGLFMFLTAGMLIAGGRYRSAQVDLA